MYPNLKLQLWKTGLRQNRLAKMLGMDESRLSKIVNGFRQADEPTRKRIAAVLNCNENWLFEPLMGEAPVNGTAVEKSG
jgi:transcriptional regulator with XRE-family HTH domain